AADAQLRQLVEAAEPEMQARMAELHARGPGALFFLIAREHYEAIAGTQLGPAPPGDAPVVVRIGSLDEAEAFDTRGIPPHLIDLGASPQREACRLLVLFRMSERLHAAFADAAARGAS